MCGVCAMCVVCVLCCADLSVVSSHHVKEWEVQHGANPNKIEVVYVDDDGVVVCCRCCRCVIVGVVCCVVYLWGGRFCLLVCCLWFCLFCVLI